MGLVHIYIYIYISMKYLHIGTQSVTCMCMNVKCMRCMSIYNINTWSSRLSLIVRIYLMYIEAFLETGGRLRTSCPPQDPHWRGASCTGPPYLYRAFPQADPHSLQGLYEYQLPCKVVICGSRETSYPQEWKFRHFEANIQSLL